MLRSQSAARWLRAVADAGRAGGRTARRVVGIDPVRLRVCVLKQRQGRVIQYETEAYVASILNTLVQPLHEPAATLADAG